MIKLLHYCRMSPTIFKRAATSIEYFVCPPVRYESWLAELILLLGAKKRLVT